MTAQELINIAIIIGIGIWIYILFKQKWEREYKNKGDKKMGLIGDAFKDIMPKKEAKKEETREEKLLKLRAEIDKELELPKFKEPEIPPMAQSVKETIEVPLESRISVLEHNLSVIFQDIDNKFKENDERLQVLEHFLLKELKEKK
jgi:hypothetical protein